MFLKEKRENISVLPRRELSILLGFSNLGRDGKPAWFLTISLFATEPFVSLYFNREVGVV